MRIVCLCALILATWPVCAALEVTYTVLCSFPGGDNGAAPPPGLIQGTDGFLYGTTSNGTNSIFRIGLDGSYTILHGFAGGAEGWYPEAALTQGSDGNFYGTTRHGGSGACYEGCGTVFRITPAGTLTTLHTFTGEDGYRPETKLLLARDGYFYGTAGPKTYRISYDGDFRVIADVGGYALVEGNDGNLFCNGPDRIFRITPAGEVTELHRLDRVTEGADMWTGLVRGWDGNFYGVASRGGAYDRGTAFRITPSGTLTVLHHFTGGSDGSEPVAPLVQAHDGNFYGSTSYGYNWFQMTPAGTVTTIHRTWPGGIDNSPLMQAYDGNFYGINSIWDVTVFRLSVTLSTSGTGCLSVEPANITFPPTGGSGSINVRALAGCVWHVINTNSFIIITSDGGGSGDGTVNFAVDFNPGLRERAGALVIGGHKVMVRQRAFDGFGAYGGLVMQEDAPSQASSGAISLLLDKTGAFSANLTLGGLRSAFTGQFDASGIATKTITRQGLNPLQVTLRTDVSGGSNTITGTVSDGVFTSMVAAAVAPFNSTNLCPWAGRYSFVLAPAGGIPYGYGYGQLTVTASGMGEMGGVLGSGAPISAVAPVLEGGVWPFYSAEGACIGWVSLSTNGAFEAAVKWFAPFTSGTTLELRGVKFVSPNVGRPPVAVSGTVTLSGGFLPADIVKNLSIDTRGKVTVWPVGSDKLKLKVRPATGQFRGSFWNGSVHRKCRIRGQLLPDLYFGAGYYPYLRGAHQTGTVVIELAP